jgi:hypothetical protein
MNYDLTKIGVRKLETKEFVIRAKANFSVLVKVSESSISDFYDSAEELLKNKCAIVVDNLLIVSRNEKTKYDLSNFDIRTLDEVDIVINSISEVNSN